jgi:hypothetical protein
MFRFGVWVLEIGIIGVKIVGLIMTLIRQRTNW